MIDDGNEDYFSESGPHTIEECMKDIKKSKLYLFTLALAFATAADAVEILCIGFIMTALKDGISTYQKELLTSAVFIGMLFGGLLFGYLSDIFGRKPCLLASLVLNVIGGIFSSVVPGINLLIVCRAISGLGIGGSIPIVFSLGAEVFPSNIRGQLLSLIASFWMVGAIYSAVTAWVMLSITNGYSWRSYAVVSALPAILSVIFIIFFTEESPRYLLNINDYKNLSRVIYNLCEIETIETNFTNKRSIDKHNKLSNHKSSSINNNTISILFSKSLYKTTLCLITIWFLLSFGSLGISTWISTLFTDINLSDPYLDVFIFSLANFPGNLVSIFFVDKLGRRTLLVWSMCLSALCSIGFAINTSQAVIVVTFAALFNAFSTTGWNSLDCMSVEYFPSNVRTSAMGLLSSSGRLGAIVAQFVNGSLESNINVLLYVTSGCMALGGIISYILPKDNYGSNLDIVEDIIEEKYSYSNINMNQF